MNNKKTVLQSKSKAKTRPISFGIIRIELVEKNIIANFEPGGLDGITFKLSMDLSADNQKSFLLVKIKCSFWFKDEMEIMSMVVDNEYFIPKLKSYIINRKFSDKGFIEYIADLSLSHTRGIQSTLIKDTLLNRLFIPVLQLDDISNEIIQ